MASTWQRPLPACLQDATGLQKGAPSTQALRHVDGHAGCRRNRTSRAGRPGAQAGPAKPLPWLEDRTARRADPIGRRHPIHAGHLGCAGNTHLPAGSPLPPNKQPPTLPAPRATAPGRLHPSHVCPVAVSRHVVFTESGKPSEPLNRVINFPSQKEIKSTGQKMFSF